MSECLVEDRICSEQNRRCKECHLRNCKEKIKVLEEEQKNEELYQLVKLKKQLPKQCRNCSFLTIVNLKRGIVYCPYMIKVCMIQDHIVYNFSDNDIKGECSIKKD